MRHGRETCRLSYDRRDGRVRLVGLDVCTSTEIIVSLYNKSFPAATWFSRQGNPLTIANADGASITIDRALPHASTIVRRTSVQSASVGMPAWGCRHDWPIFIRGHVAIDHKYMSIIVPRITVIVKEVRCDCSFSQHYSWSFIIRYHQ